MLNQEWENSNFLTRGPNSGNYFDRGLHEYLQRELGTQTYSKTKKRFPL